MPRILLMLSGNVVAFVTERKRHELSLIDSDAQPSGDYISTAAAAAAAAT